MKKYFSIYKMTLIENFQYIGNILSNFINFLIIIIIFINLWQTIYENDVLIKGYSLNQMIWYFIITELLWFIARGKTLTNDISDDIKNGKIAYVINKPYHYVLFNIFKFLGEVTIKALGIIPLTILVGIILNGPIFQFKLGNMIFIIIVFILSILINALIRTTISLTSFWFEENKPFHWLYDKLILVVGVLFPIEFFPLFLRPIIKYSPVFVVTYGPAKLVVDFDIKIFYEILKMQTIYLVLLILIINLIYKRGVKKLNVNGG